LQIKLKFDVSHRSLEIQNIFKKISFSRQSFSIQNLYENHLYVLLFYKTIFPIFKIRKNNNTFENTLVCDIENKWFMDFKYIPLKKNSISTEKYNKEIFRMTSSSKNAKQLINNYLSKIFKEDFSNRLVDLLQSSSVLALSKAYCMKVKDSFQGKAFGFEIIISACGNEVDFTIKIKDIVVDDFSDSLPDLVSYLKKEVYDPFFGDKF